MKTHYFKNILTILISLLGLQDTKICFVHSMDYTNCNKLWGVTQDANGRMLYKVGMYMCVEDPYNIYKNAYSSQIAPPLLLQNPQPNNITVNNSNITMQNITNISPNLVNETKNVSIINESSFKVYNKTLNTSTTPQIIPTTSTTTRQITTTNIMPTTTTIIPTTTQKIITTTQQTTTIAPTTTNSRITYTEVLNKSKNKTNQSYGFTNLRSSSNKQKETEKKDEVDVILIVAICCTVVILNIIGVVVYIKCKKDKINKKKDQTKVKDEMNTQDNQTDKNIVKTDPTKIKVKPNNNIPLNKQHKPQVNLSVDTNKGKELKLNHKALTPNTKQILNESEASIKNWYKKTFKNELKECSDDVPMPPVSKVYPLSQNQKQSNNKTNKPNNKTNKPNAPVLKKNVKKLINVHEMKIKEAQRNNRNIPTNHYNRQHNVINNTTNQHPNYQIQYLNNRGQSSHQNNHFAK